MPLRCCRQETTTIDGPKVAAGLPNVNGMTSNVYTTSTHGQSVLAPVVPQIRGRSSGFVALSLRPHQSGPAIPGGPSNAHERAATGWRGQQPNGATDAPPPHGPDAQPAHPPLGPPAACAAARRPAAAATASLHVSLRLGSGLPATALAVRYACCRPMAGSVCRSRSSPDGCGRTAVRAAGHRIATCRTRARSPDRPDRLAPTCPGKPLDGALGVSANAHPSGARRCPGNLTAHRAGNYR